MAEVTVFVDDAVRGRLPDVCAKDGVPTTSRFRIEREVNGSTRLGVLWLLVLAGPLGWIALLFLAGRSDGEKLAVELPYSDAAYARFADARRLRAGAVVAGVIGGFGLLALTSWAQLGGAGLLLALGVAAVALVLAVVADWRMERASVDIQLDASRRWVGLRRVHPSFADACRRQLAHEHQHQG